MGETGVRPGRKKDHPVTKFKVETCWPLSPHIWRTVVEWETAREAYRSVTALKSMRYPVRMSVQFLDGVSCMPGHTPLLLAELTVLELDKWGGTKFARYTPLCRFLPVWVYGGEPERAMTHG